MSHALLPQSDTKSDLPVWKHLLVSPTGEKSRNYDLQTNVRKGVFDRRKGKRRTGRLDSRIITAAYRHLVAPFFTRHKPHRRAFTEHTVPYLVRNTSPTVTAILSGVWFHKHGKGSYKAFMGEVMTAVALAKTPHSPAYAQLRTQRQREALSILRTLSGLANGEPFLMPVRELQLRLLLPTPATASRILGRLAALDFIEVIDPGLSRPEAAKTGDKARAGKYRLKRPV